MSVVLLVGGVGEYLGVWFGVGFERRAGAVGVGIVRDVVFSFCLFSDRS